MSTDSSPSLPSPPPKLHSLLRRTDATLTHLSRILSTPSGTDTTLLTLSYTLTLLHAQLTTHIESDLTRLALSLAAKATPALAPGETVIASLPAPSHLQRLSRVAAAAKALQSLVSDVRIFARLWGLLAIYAWAKSVHAAPPTDAVLRAVAWGQVAACMMYQVLENAAYLARHGVLGWDARRQARAWVWSSRFWAAHVGLEFARLGRVWVLRRRERGGGEGKEVVEGGEKEGDGAEVGEKEWEVRGREEDAVWWREFVENCAWAPLTVHWSLEEGAVSDSWVGFLGSVVGVLRFRELWRRTA